MRPPRPPASRRASRAVGPPGTTRNGRHRRAALVRRQRGRIRRRGRTGHLSLVERLRAVGNRWSLVLELPRTARSSPRPEPRRQRQRVNGRGSRHGGSLNGHAAPPPPAGPAQPVPAPSRHVSRGCADRAAADLRGRAVPVVPRRRGAPAEGPFGVPTPAGANADDAAPDRPPPRSCSARGARAGPGARSGTADAGPRTARTGRRAARRSPAAVPPNEGQAAAAKGGSSLPKRTPRATTGQRPAPAAAVESEPARQQQPEPRRPATVRPPAHPTGPAGSGPQ